MQCPSPISIKDPNGQHNWQRIQVPCGKCGACKHNRRADWSFRLQQELRDAESALFLTLTYSDENLPFTEHGEITLRKKDTQLFMKRLRKEHSKHSDAKIRYYTVGEYGTNTKRPHYHSIIFNLTVETLNKMDTIWQHGHHHIGTISPASIHYVTKYHVNPNHYPDDIEPEFATMSRNPGIGYNYIKRAKKWHRENGYHYVINNGFKQRLPEYYAKKIFTDYERQLRAEKLPEELDKAYEQEFNRLKRLKIADPDHNIFRSQVYQAEKLSKDNKSNLF